MGDCCSKGPENKALPLETHPEHEKSITCMCLSDDCSLLITGSDDCTARMWSAKTRKSECLGLLKGHTQYITCVAMAEAFVLTGSADTHIRKWDMTTCECLAVYRGHTSRIFRIIATSEFIFSTSYDTTAKAWLFDETESDSDSPCIMTFKGHTRAVLPIIFIPGNDLSADDDTAGGINPGDVVVTGSADGTARSWAFETGGVLKTFKGHGGPISCMATDALGKNLFTGSMDKTIRSWDISNGRCLKVFEGHENGIMSIQVVKTMLYSGGTDGIAKCWVTDFGDCTRTYRGHKHTVSCLKYHDGILYTGSGDTIIRAFDAKSGTLRREYRGHEAGVNCLVIVDGYIYSGSNDGSMMKWDASGISEDMGEIGTGNFSESFHGRQNQRLEELDGHLDSYMDKD